jgi:hypothetical protein
MMTFKQYLTEREREAYGWLNDKGSFIKNRKGRIHGDTYSKFTGHGKADGDDGAGYYDKIDHALQRGWARLSIMRGDNADYGVIQRKASKWTPRHDKGMRLIRKALGKTKRGHSDEVEVDDR